MNAVGTTGLNLCFLRWSIFSTTSFFSVSSSTKKYPSGNLYGLLRTASFILLVSTPYNSATSASIRTVALRLRSGAGEEGRFKLYKQTTSGAECQVNCLNIQMGEDRLIPLSAPQSSSHSRPFSLPFRSRSLSHLSPCPSPCPSLSPLSSLPPD